MLVAYGETLSRDLAGLRVEADVDLAPGAPLRLAVLPLRPLPLAVDLQAGRVDDDVARLCFGALSLLG